MKAPLLLLATALTCFGQGFFSFEVPLPGSAATAPFTPASLPGLAFQWVASDLTVSNNVTDWVDRIQHYHWTQSSAGSQPTNSALGVRFYVSGGMRYLNVTNLCINLNQVDSWYMVITPDAQSGDDHYILAHSFNSGGCRGGFHIDSSGRLANNVGLVLKAASQINGTTFDFSGSWIGTNNIYYTNGIPQTTNNTVVAGGTLYYVGALADSGGDPAYRGYISEFGIYTNTSLNQAQITLLHNYATNIYNITP